MNCFRFLHRLIIMRQKSITLILKIRRMHNSIIYSTCTLVKMNRWTMASLGVYREWNLMTSIRWNCYSKRVDHQMFDRLAVSIFSFFFSTIQFDLMGFLELLIKIIFSIYLASSIDWRFLWCWTGDTSANWSWNTTTTTHRWG